MKSPIILLQERDFGQKINATFEFAIQNFKPMVLCLAYIAGPPALISGFFMGSYQTFITTFQQQVMGGKSIGQNNDYSSIALYLLLFVIFFGIANLASALVVNAFMLEYEEGNRNITPDVIWRRMKNYILNSIGYSVVMFLFVIFALLLLIIPGIYVSIVLSLTYIVMMRENLGLGDTFRRCFYLIEGKWWSTFGLLLILGFISGIVGYVFQIPSQLLLIAQGLQLTTNIPDYLNTLSGILSAIGSVLVRSLVLVGTVFQYYNLVERRDGEGIMTAINNIGKSKDPRTYTDKEEF